MKKRIIPVLAAAGMLLLQGCAGGSVTESTIEISKKGAVTQTSIGTLDADYYDSDELKSYVEDQIDAYNESEDAIGSVKLKKYKYSASDSSVKLVLKFSDDETYADFEQMTFFTGTVEEAKAAGYAFDVTLITPQEAQSEDASGDASGDDAAASEAEESGDASADAAVSDGTQDLALSGTENVVILQESYHVTVPGEILYVTQGACSVVSDDTASVDADGADLVYIIYE